MIAVRYLDLINEFPLKPIQSESELDQAMRVIDRLVVKRSLTQGERNYLDVLTDIVEKYENEHYQFDLPSDARILEYLIATEGLTLQELARISGIADSTFLAVLKGVRELTPRQVEKLRRCFHLNPATVISASGGRTSVRKQGKRSATAQRKRD